MSDDRLFHKRLGHSAKVNSLTDLEELAWRTYVQEADDFGVMLFNALELQKGHDRLAKRPSRHVQRMLERVCGVDLIRTFTHQGLVYCYQWDWQDWQKRRYASGTIHPRLPADVLETCSLATQWLHTIWPGGSRDTKLPTWEPETDWTPPDWRNGSGNGSVLRARGRGTRASSSTGSSESKGTSTGGTRTASGGGARAEHPNCHLPCDRICLSEKQHRLFLQRFGETPDAEAQLEQFYADTRASIPSGPFGDKPWQFWDRHFAARFDSVAPREAVAAMGVSRKTSGNVTNLQRFVERGSLLRGVPES